MTDSSPFCAAFFEGVRIMQRSIKETLAEIAARNGLTAFQSYVLDVLKAHDGEPLKEISRRMCVAPSNLTPLLRELDEAGYVRREQDPGDRRSYRLWLTEAGREKSNQIDRETVAAFGGDDERAPELQARVLDGIAAYYELMALAPERSHEEG